MKNEELTEQLITIFTDSINVKIELRKAQDEIKDLKSEIARCLTALESERQIRAELKETTLNRIKDLKDYLNVYESAIKDRF